MVKIGLKNLFRGAIVGLLFVVLSVAVLTVRGIRPISDLLIPGQGKALKASFTDRYHRPLSVTYVNSLNYHDIAQAHQMPEILRRAFVISEDRRFLIHNGIDWRARLAAIYSNVKNLKSVRGASTITEQVVRILHPRPRTLWSRWLEGWEAMSLERYLSKEEILELYLNQVPYGGNRRGIVQAGRYYFDRDLETLNLKEQLALVALVRAPARFDPFTSLALLESRVTGLCRTLATTGEIESERCEQVSRMAMDLRRSGEPVNASHFIRHLSEFTSAQRADTNRIATTLDGTLQIRLQKLIDGHIAALVNSNVRNGAIIVVDHISNEVLAWVNSGANANGNAISHIDAVTAVRQPGSTLKPFLYALAVERGWTPATVLDDAPLKHAVGTGTHSYRNFSRVFYGPVRLRDALGNSLNTPAVRTVSFVGVPAFLDFLRELGFISLKKPANFYGEGLALGNGEVSLLELVQAYAVLARGGVYQPLRFTIRDPAPRKISVEKISRESAQIITNILSDPNARRLEFGRGGLLGLSQQAAVKTGTSTDFRDLWALGYSDRFTVGVWMGNLDRAETRNVTSSSGPGIILKAVFHELHRLHSPRALRQDGALERARICALSGLLAGASCPVIDEIFTLGYRPLDICEGHSAGNSSNSSRKARNLPDVPKISFPTRGMTVARDPRIPDELEAISFALNDGEIYSEVSWILDGLEIGKGKRPRNEYVWAIEPGRHSLYARAVLPDRSKVYESAPINFMVK